MNQVCALLPFSLLLLALSSGISCSSPSPSPDATSDLTQVSDSGLDAYTPDSASDLTQVSDSESDTLAADSASDLTQVSDSGDSGEVYWENIPFENEYFGFDRSNFEPVYGWILLDNDHDKVLSDIDAAATYGVNHIQLSHDIIMDIDDLVGDDAETQARVRTVKDAVEKAHGLNMKVYVWAHEFQAGDIIVCYGQDGPIWKRRADAYRKAFEMVPDLDGVILMFGSAGASPWFTLCDCDWCTDTFPDQENGNPPPQDVRIQLVVEQVGATLKDLGKEMIVRVFAHEPDENPWHADGLARSRNVEFVSMHKSEVGDWQPYNPHDPTLGQVGRHPSILEMDAAGEYFGRSELPFASPAYYRYRLKHAYDLTAIGAVARIARGSDTALNTPNEVNLRAIAAWISDQSISIDDVWQTFLLDKYLAELSQPSQESRLLQKILESSLTVMTKTHYVLGIWALEKSSDIPSSPSASELGGRGNMPKWNSAWQEIYDRVKQPDYETVLQIFNEGTEGVEVAEWAFDTFILSEWNIDPTVVEDLSRRLKHQLAAAKVWRSIKLYIFATRAAVYDPENQLILNSFAAWALDDLLTVAGQMEMDGLEDVSVCSPSRVRGFVNAAPDFPDLTPVEPDRTTPGPIWFTAVSDSTIGLRFDACTQGTYAVEYGTEFPDFSDEHLIGVLEPPQGECQSVEVTLDDLQPDTRYILRLRLSQDDSSIRRSGDFWEMTRNHKN